MTTSSNPSKVIPAQLSFLAIYNPSLGPTDETFQDQLVFYYSRAAHDARVAAKKNARNDLAGGDALRNEENEKLRQIGLAQGMVDFAKSFSNGEPVDSIETERSRIVLYELEEGWWILASIDLTRLPSLSQSSSSTAKAPGSKTTTDSKVEYSTREISPPHLLLQQLLQAHNIFCLHHGPSLHDLFVRLTRDKFASTLDRFWTRFARTWDVLLHGNPAADVFGGVKLAAGGELGFGVGEEDWGSGEREVLEDLLRRTEGLADLIVARFGEPVSADARKAEEDDEEVPPWMGAGVEPLASDGVIFGGIGAVTRQSLRDMSLWMRQVYMYGDQAYGIRDNPLRERRKRKRRERGEPNLHANRLAENEEPSRDGQNDLDLKPIPQEQPVAEEAQAPSALDEQPLIPPPIVSTAAHTYPNPTAGADQEDKQQQSEGEEPVDEAGTTLGIPDQYMKYLTFGLSTLGKQKRPSTARRTSAASTITPQAQTRTSTSKPSKLKSSLNEDGGQVQSMSHVEPMPDGEKLRSRLAAQKKQENRGHFVIGLKGNLLELDELSEDDEQTELSDGDDGIKSDGSRIVLRTIQVELTPRDPAGGDETEGLVPTPMSEDPPPSGSGNGYRRVRVVLYVHRPFMYCFLFASRTSSLQYTGFYKSLHRNLVPIHKPLLNSTNVEKVRQRIESSQLLPTTEDPESEVRSVRSQKSTTTARSPSRKQPANENPIYDLIYDPKRLTLHTSIPNIPLPGTPAAEGLSGLFKSSGADGAPLSNWTRIEALNVHSQILNTLASVQHRRYEIERTSKTVRGWWVVWLKVAASPSSASPGVGKGGAASTMREATSSVQTFQSTDAVKDMSEGNENHRIAFLVRKASDSPSSAAPKPASTGSKAVSSMLEVMSLGMAGGGDDSAPGAGDGWGPAAPAGALAGGMGIDARKYVQGLLSLNR